MVTYQINNVCMHGVSYMCSSKNDTHGVFILSVTVKQSADKASDQSQINVFSSILFLSFFHPCIFPYPILLDTGDETRQM